MHTVELLEQAIATAQQLGYGIRQEWLGGIGGGACEFGGQKWIFIDLSLNAIEQLDQVSDALRADVAIHTIELSESMRKCLGVRGKAA